MIKLLETTVWEAFNHTYFVNESKDRLLGYHPVGGEPIMFSKGLKFNTRKRTFKVIK